MRPARGDLQRALRASPPALDAAAGLIDDLGYDPRPLQQLVRSGDRVVDAIDRADPGVGQVVQDAARTFAAVAAQGRALERALHDTPATLVAARATLGHADETLGATSEVLGALRTGRARGAARGPPARGGAERPAVGGAGRPRDSGEPAPRIAPDLTRSAAARRAARPDDRLGRRGVGQAAGAASAPTRPRSTGCCRRGGRGRGASATARTSTCVRRSARTRSRTSRPGARRRSSRAPRGLRVAFPQPPGFVAGQPWFQPQCGITKDVFDPAKDPESQAKELYPKAFYERRYPDPETGK